MSDEQRVTESIELDDDVLEDVSGGADTVDDNNNNNNNNQQLD